MEKFFGVGHVEIPCYQHISATPVALTQHRMAIFNFVLTVCTVSKVSEPNFARISYVFLQPFSIFKFIRIIAENIFIFFVDFIENINNWSIFNRTIATNITMAWSNIQFYISDSCSILATIRLFFHQHIQSLNAIKGRTIFVDVVLKWFAKTNKGNATFVFNCVAH